MMPWIADDQREIFALLQDPATHGGITPIRIDTHGAALFLAGPDVYKIKRAVHFPFMDFSTLEKRHAACEAEILVNRDNAPDLYLGVIPITRENSGLRLGGEGAAIEWAVHLRRFDENATLDRVAARGPLDATLIDRLARAVAASHRRAPVRSGSEATRILRRLAAETVEELAGYPDLFEPAGTARFGRSLLEAFDRNELLLLRRGSRGQVRRCHGDLHLGNIVLIGGEPVLFDAIEFDEAIATSDILYDLAFLVMDLCERGLRANANRLLNRVLAISGDLALQIEGLAAFPFFLALRAAIRAKVLAAAARQDAGQSQAGRLARAYFEAAAGFLEPVPARLIAIGGLSGTGKSTLAAALAPEIGRAPGAIHLRSDIERKRLAGVEETVRLPPESYQPAVSAMVYERLATLAETALRAGQAVIVDATHQRASERAATQEIATRSGVAFLGLWLEAPLALLLQRVAARTGDASDATACVVALQAREPEGEVTWRRLDASQKLQDLKMQALG